MTVRPISPEPANLMEKIDRIDLRILSELQKAGRITNYRLSELVGISASPCHKRVKRLERMGLISGYRARIAWARLYPNVRIFAFVTLKNHGASDFQIFERHIRSNPLVTGCFGLCGSYDNMLRFDCVDLIAYEAASSALLAGDVPLARFDSFVVLREIKDEQPAPAEINPPLRRAA
jgi:DNA-binding Lrp family transcriptional regulator